jgi:hypothetical protein
MEEVVVVVTEHSRCVFLPAVQINYTARVEATTGLPPGKKEDMFANCLYNRLYVRFRNSLQNT